MSSSQQQPDFLSISEEDGALASDLNETSIASSIPQQQQQPEHSRGIDIRQALHILSSRTPHFHALHKENHHRNHHAKYSDTGCSCQEGHDVSDDMKQMGQTIDLLATAPTTAPSATTTNPIKQISEEDQSKQLKEAEQERTKKAEQHKAELAASLQTMPKTSHLLRALLRAQEDRVQTYRSYDTSLQRILETGNLTTYPPACASATASFAVLSDTIKAIADELARRSANNSHNTNAPQYVKWIQTLQALEREKLQLTAALHLEKIRARNQQEVLRQRLVTTITKHNGDEALAFEDEKEQRVLKLLHEGIVALQENTEKCVGKINGVLEDLRCALVEEVEDEDE